MQVELVAGRVAIGTITLGRIGELAERDDVVSIGADHQGGPELKDSVPDIKANLAHASPLQLTGQGVIVGVVDTGVDIFHRNFRRANGTTRLLSLLDLTAPRITLSITGTPLAGANFDLSWTAPAFALPAAPPAPTTTIFGIPATAMAAAVAAALTGFSGITPADIAVTGGPLPASPVVIDFVGRYADKAIDPMHSASNVNFGTAALGIESGRLFSEKQINAALNTPDKPFASQDTERHGTHVLGTAGGDGSQAGSCHGSDVFVGVAPAADLMMVKTSFDNTGIIRGTKHILDMAAPFNRDTDTAATFSPAKAAVVNLSLGGALAAHDGTDHLDLALDELLTDKAGTPLKGRAVVCSAGNDGQRVDPLDPNLNPVYRGGGLHCHKRLTPAAPSVTLDLHIATQDKKTNKIVFWYGNPGDPAKVDCQIAEPGGTSLPVVVAGSASPTPAPVLAGSAVTVVSGRNATQNNRHFISIRIDPPAGGAIQAGPWKLTFTETTANATDLDGWIGLDKTDPHPRFAFADQVSTGTLTSPGTGRNVVTVGSYDRRDATLAESSSRGPTLDGRHKPDLSAPGVGILAPKAGVATIGCCSGEGCCCACCTDFYISLDGTSMAAPHVTGVVALMLQRNRELTFQQLRSTLVATCRPPGGGPAVPTPADSWGAGRIDAEKACLAVTPHASARHLHLVQVAEPLLLPVPAYPAAFLSRPERLRAVQDRLVDAPAAQLGAALVSAHVDEVMRLLDADRRTALAWQRMHGPELVRLLLYDSTAPTRPLPATLGGRPLAAGLERLLDALERVGSPALRADITRYRAFVLALPGARLDDLPLAG